MKINFNNNCAKVKMSEGERLEITFPSGKVICLESFASPDFDQDCMMIECVIARTKEKKSAAENSRLNGYLWSNEIIKHSMNFDPANPDKKLVGQVLYQAFDGGSSPAPKDVYGEAWCLRDMELPAWMLLKEHLISNKLIEESGEPNYYKITRKGEEVSCGGDY